MTTCALAMIRKMFPEQLSLQGTYGETALIHAITTGHTEIAKALIEKMSPDQLSLPNKHGTTELTYLMYFDNTEIARALIDKMNSDQLSLKDKRGETALNHAITRECTEIAKALIDKMSPDQLSLQDKNGETALIHAITRERTEIAKALIDKMLPSQISLKNKNDDTALTIAISWDDTELAKALIDKMSPDQLFLKNKAGDTALTHAISKGHTDIAKALIDKMLSSQLSLQDKDACAALAHAISKDYTDIAKALIDKMTSEQLSLQNNYGNTALNYAISKDYTEIAKALIDKMSPDQLCLKDQNGDIELTYAILWGRTEVAKALIDKMSPDQLFLKNEDGDTALTYAITMGLTEIAKALIEKMLSSQLSLQDKDACAALTHAISKDYTDIAKGLVEKMTSEQLSLQDKDGNTAVTHAITMGHTEIAKALIEKIINKEILTDSTSTILLALQLIGNRVNDLSDQLVKLVKEYDHTTGQALEQLMSIKTSHSWLERPKSIEEASAAINQENYLIRANSLKTNVLKLFNELNFGVKEEQINPGCLGKASKDDVEKALAMMCETMLNKKPFLGTPKEDDAEGLHRFYSEMLSNFETVVEKLSERQDPEATASFLTAIASAKLENRCAAAYQAEILQAKLLLGDVKAMSIENTFQAIANQLLQQIIEKIVKEEFDSDVHSYSQFSYFVGLSKVPDPLSNFTTEDAFQHLGGFWTTPFILNGFSQDLKDVNKEALFDWFKEHMPADFGPQKRLTIEAAKNFEKGVLESLNSSLDSKDITGQERADFLSFIQSCRGATLSFPNQAIPQVLLDAVVKEGLENTFDKKILEEKLESFRPKRQEGQTPAAFVHERREFTTALTQIAKRNQLINELRKIFHSASKETLDNLITVKSQMESQMKEWCEQNDIGYNTSRSPLPSILAEEDLRSEYASSHFNDSDGNLTIDGILAIIKHLELVEQL